MSLLVDETELLYLAFVNNAGIPIFEIDFRVKGMDYDSVLLAGFVSAMKSFSHELSQKSLKVIDQGDVKIGLEEGKLASAIFIVGSINEELKRKIKSLLETFELRYGEVLQSDAIDSSAFNSFKEHTMQVLSKGVIKNYYVVDFCKQAPQQSISEDFWPVISSINGKRTVKQIVQQINMDLQSVLEILASLKTQGVVDFHISVDKYDIPILTPIGTTHLFDSRTTTYQELDAKFDEQIHHLIKEIDGKHSINMFSNLYKINSSDLLKLFKFLLAKGCVDLLSEELKSCLIIEKMYNYLFRTLNQNIGTKTLQIFLDALETEQNNLTRFINIYKNNVSFDTVRMQLTNQPPINFLEMLESLLLPFCKILESLESLSGSKRTVKIKNQIIDKLKTDFGSDIIIDIERMLG